MLRRDYIRITKLFKLHVRKADGWLKKVYEALSEEQKKEVGEPPVVDAKELEEEKGFVKEPIKEEKKEEPEIQEVTDEYIE